MDLAQVAALLEGAGWQVTLWDTATTPSLAPHRVRDRVRAEAPDLLIGTALTVNLPTLLLGRAVQGVAAAWLTRIAGASFITYFEQDQDWGDGGMQEVVQNHYNLNSRDSSLKRFLEMALRQVVEPLQRQKHRQLTPRPGPRGEVAEEDRGHPEP